MANTTTSPAMSLPIPIVGIDPGPQWAIDVDSCLTIIDGHNHSAGQGNPVTPSGLNISSDLTFNNNNATAVRSLRFQSQSTTLGLISDVGCVYEVTGNLWYNNGSGVPVQITNGSSIVGTAGSITGLVPPASASYNTGSATFIWQSDANTPANLDAASVLFRNLSAGSNAVTLNPPSSLGSNYSLTLPTIPASQMFMTLDNAGNMAAPWAVDNSTIEVASGTTVQVKDGGITDAKIQAGGLNTPSYANNSVTTIKRAPTVISFGSSSGSYNNATNGETLATFVNITSTGKGVQIQLTSVPGTSEAFSAYFNANAGTGVSAFTKLWLVSGVTPSGGAVLATWIDDIDRSFNNIPLTIPQYVIADGGLSAGVYTLYITTRLSTVGGQINMNFMQLVAYEL